MIEKQEGERRQVTVLLCDMKGYTPLAERIGEEATYGLINQVYEAMVDTVRKQGGTVQELTGDGILALFGAPVAVEDAPIRACRAALLIKDRITQLGQMSELTHGQELKVRIGINTGMVIVGTVGPDGHKQFKAVGDTVNLASRLESLAEPGTCLISEATKVLVAPHANTTYLGEQEVKGKRIPVGVYRLDSLKPQGARFEAARQRGLSPLVGREKELALLQRMYEDSRKGGLQVVELIGEAGIGKSRLIHEFLQSLQHLQPNVHCGFCASDGKTTPFLPFVEILRSMFSLREPDPNSDIPGKVTEKISLLGIDPESTGPYVYNLLGLDFCREALRGLDGALIGARTRDILYSFIQAEAKKSQLIVVIDDVHWIDSSSTELLVKMLREYNGIPLLLVVAYRPGFQTPLDGYPFVRQIHLAQLSDEQTMQIAQKMLGSRSIEYELRQVIVTKGGGNPLFTEEITRYLITDDSVKGSTKDHSHNKSRSRSVPSSLHDLLMSRIDQLDSETRDVLNIAAVIGRRIPAELMETITIEVGGSAIALKRLEEHDFLERSSGDRTYQFRHVLIQEAVYSCLLTQKRAVLHKQVGEAIERLYGTRLEEWAEVLANHYSQTAEIDKAVRYLRLAGDRSRNLYSLDEADHYYAQALVLVEKSSALPYVRALAEIIVCWAWVYYYRMDFNGLISLLEKHRPQIERLNDRRLLSLCFFWLGHSYVQCARCDVAMPLLEQALRLGEELNDRECIGHAAASLTFAYWVQQGRYSIDRIIDLTERVVKIAGDLNNAFLGHKVLVALAVSHIAGGRYFEAKETCQRLFDLAETYKDKRGKAFGAWVLGFVHLFEERYEEAISNAEQALKISPDPMDRVSARGLKGAAMALMGHPHEGLDLLQDVRREVVESGFLTLLIGIDISFGAALVLAGRISEGVSWIEATNERFISWGNEVQPALGNLVLGEVYLQMLIGKDRIGWKTVVRNAVFILSTIPRVSRKAQSHFEEAIRRARLYEIPAVLARGLLDLALLATAQNRLKDAQRYLNEAMEVATDHRLETLREKIRLEQLKSLNFSSQ
jgi:class 3 adenylate cyclase/tetratricopeptide (TPR) repeat protein